MALYNMGRCKIDLCLIKVKLDVIKGDKNGSASGKYRNRKRVFFDQLTGTQKSAILMMLIGEDEASEILRNLSPREVQHLGTAMYSVQGLDQETVNLVLDEFLAIIKAQTSLGMGAGNYIRNVMVKHLARINLNLY